MTDFKQFAHFLNSKIFIEMTFCIAVNLIKITFLFYAKTNLKNAFNFNENIYAGNIFSSS